MAVRFADHVSLCQAVRVAALLVLALLLALPAPTASTAGSRAGMPSGLAAGLVIEGTARQHSATGPRLAGVTVHWECVQHPDLTGEAITTSDGTYQIGPLSSPDLPVTVHVWATHAPTCSLLPTGTASGTRAASS